MHSHIWLSSWLAVFVAASETAEIYQTWLEYIFCNTVCMVLFVTQLSPYSAFFFLLLALAAEKKKIILLRGVLWGFFPFSIVSEEGHDTCCSLDAMLCWPQHGVYLNLWASWPGCNQWQTRHNMSFCFKTRPIDDLSTVNAGVLKSCAASLCGRW